LLGGVGVKESRNTMKKPKWSGLLYRRWHRNAAGATSLWQIIAKSLKSFLPRHWSWIVGTTAGVVLLWTWVGTLSPVVGATAATHTVMSTTENVIWGELFKPDSKPILSVNSGDRIVMQTISHEGILADQGDTTEFFTKAGITKDKILPDQLTVKAKVEKTGPGPHVITGPIFVEGAEPGDVLEIKTLKIDYRAPYGVISNRHSKGALPGEYPENDAPIYSKVILIDAARKIGVFRPSNGRPNVDIPLKPFMGIMGVVPANRKMP
jgi:hypothetical protein